MANTAGQWHALIGLLWPTPQASQLTVDYLAIVQPLQQHNVAYLRALNISSRLLLVSGPQFAERAASVAAEACSLLTSKTCVYFVLPKQFNENSSFWLYIDWP